jgi:hypothetical protein
MDGYISADLKAQMPHNFSTGGAAPLSPSLSIVSIGVSMLGVLYYCLMPIRRKIWLIVCPRLE